MFSILDWKKSEMVFVVGVILLIVAISYSQVKLGEMKTRDAQRKSDVEMVARGLRKYMADYHFLPREATGSGKIVACGYMGTEVCEWGFGPVTDADGVAYINKLPEDPMSAKGYNYMYKPSADGSSFRLYIGLENRSDKAYRSNLTEMCGNNVQCSWYVE